MNNSVLSFLTDLNNSFSATGPEAPAEAQAGDLPTDGVNPFFTAFQSLADQTQTPTQPLQGQASLTDAAVAGLPGGATGQKGLTPKEFIEGFETPIRVDELKGRIAIEPVQFGQANSQLGSLLITKAMPSTEPLGLSSELSGQEIALPVDALSTIDPAIAGDTAAIDAATSEAIAFWQSAVQPYGAFSFPNLKLPPNLPLAAADFSAIAPVDVAANAAVNEEIAVATAVPFGKVDIANTLSLGPQTGPALAAFNTAAANGGPAIDPARLNALSQYFQNLPPATIALDPGAGFTFDEAALQQFVSGNGQQSLLGRDLQGLTPVSPLQQAAIGNVQGMSVEDMMKASPVDGLDLSALDLEENPRSFENLRGDRADRLMPTMFSSMTQTSPMAATMVPLATEQMNSDEFKAANVVLDEAALAGSSSATGSERTMTTAAVQQSAPTAAAVVAQVFTAISQRGGDSKIEVRLDPPELGRVVIGFEGAGHEIVRAVVSADSQQTLDLLRRNLDMLQRELERAGLEDINVEVSDQETQSDTQESPAEANTYAVIEDYVEPGEGARQYATPMIDGRLDLRV